MARQLIPRLVVSASILVVIGHAQAPSGSQPSAEEPSAIADFGSGPGGPGDIAAITGFVVDMQGTIR